jgi:hypothetical protein
LTIFGFFTDELYKNILPNVVESRAFDFLLGYCDHGYMGPVYAGDDVKIRVNGYTVLTRI